MSVRKFTEFLESIVLESCLSSSTSHPQQIRNKFCRKSDIWDQTRLLPFASPPHSTSTDSLPASVFRNISAPCRTNYKKQPLLLRSCRKSRGWSFTSLLSWEILCKSDEQSQARLSYALTQPKFSVKMVSDSSVQYGSRCSVVLIPVVMEDGL